MTRGSVRRRRDGALEGGEEQLQAAILDLARLLGWLAYHTHDSRASAQGFPDLVLVRPPRLVFAELKAWPEGTVKGDPTAAQRVWLDRLGIITEDVSDAALMSRGHELYDRAREPSLEVYVWRWADWTSGDVERILR